MYKKASLEHLAPRSSSIHLLLILVSMTLIAAVLFATLAPQPGAIRFSARGNIPAQPFIPPAEAQTSDNSQLYLPLIIGLPGYSKIVGVEIETASYMYLDIQKKADNAGVFWARVPAFSWLRIEPTRYNPPVYDWSGINETALINLSSLGFQVIGTIKYTPSWAQLYPPNNYCGPVASDYLDEFAQFVKQTVARYSVPPYNILYWEIGNEPDVDRSFVRDDSNYGCWGEKTDKYYGGRYYGNMLKYVYPAIKSANPNAQVLIGGLLMECDPNHPPPNKDCSSSKFFEGILRGGGGPYFDIVSFHGYANYWNSFISDENSPNWSYRGGVVVGKINFLREVMSTFNINKPIIHTEGSLICPESNATQCVPPIPEFFEKQADYVVWLYVRNWAQGLIGTIWYEMGGYYTSWKYASLLDQKLSPKLSYYALQFLSKELQGGVYQRQITSYPGLRVYEFSARWRTIWVAWAPDELPHTMTLPASTLQVLDKYGNLIQPTNGVITVMSPVYIEMIP